MGEAHAPARTVGLREANQRASQIYREVQSSGVPVTVTDRGRPVVEIVPVRAQETWYERMLRQGRIRPARRRVHVPQSGVRLPDGVSLEDLLAQEREDRC